MARRVATQLLGRLLMSLVLWLGAAYFLLLAGMSEGLVVRLVVVGVIAVLLGMLVGLIVPATSRASWFLRDGLPALPLAVITLVLAWGMAKLLAALAWKIMELVLEVLAGLEGISGGP